VERSSSAPLPRPFDEPNGEGDGDALDEPSGPVRPSVASLAVPISGAYAAVQTRILPTREGGDAAEHWIEGCTRIARAGDRRAWARTLAEATTGLFEAHGAAVLTREPSGRYGFSALAGFDGASPDALPFVVEEWVDRLTYFEGVAEVDLGDVVGFPGEAHARAFDLRTVLLVPIEAHEGARALLALARFAEHWSTSAAERRRLVAWAGHAAAVLDRIEAEASRLARSDRLATAGAFGAAALHEIANPLTLLLANLREARLASRGASPGARLDTERLLAAAEAGAVAAHAIAADAKLLMHERPGALGRIDVAAVTRSTLKFAEPALRESARVRSELGPTPEVLADAARLAQVLSNLLLNAAQAAGHGVDAPHAITVATSTASDGGALVEVRDSGVGIDARSMPRIFEPFFTTKPPGVGTGLGLPIARGIVESFGGSLSVSSAPGRGTIVRVWLPPAPHEGRPAPRVTEAATSSEPMRPKVLIVDDEPQVGAAIARLLEERFEVCVVGRGLDALARVDAGERFDAMICDVRMPGLDGLALRDALLMRGAAFARRTVFLSGAHLDDEHRARAEQGNATLFEKPLDVERLIEALDAMLER
jgi:signal transduction histidine kinase/CheY-like chemotaxis protein